MTEESKESVKQLLKALLCEFVGTFILNFFGCSSVLQDNPVFIPFGFGLAVFVANASAFHISGGHVNPAVTIAVFVSGKISALKALFYVLVQLLGAVTGSGVLRLLCSCHTCPTTLAIGVSIGVGFCFEFFLGFLLLWIIFSLTEVAENEKHYTSSLVIGLTIALGHFSVLKFTGSSMNPARSLGSAIASGNYKNIWIYMVAPTMGGIVAALLHDLCIEGKFRGSGMLKMK